MNLNITNKLIQYAYRDNYRLERIVHFRFCMIGVMLIIILVETVVLLNHANDYLVEDPFFIDENGEAHRYYPLLNSLPTLKHISNYSVTVAEELMSLDFHEMDKQLLDRKEYFLPGKWDEYIKVLLGTDHVTSIFNSADGSYISNVLNNSLVVTAVRRSDPVITNGPFLQDGRDHFTIQVALWQSYEGLNEKFNSRSMNAYVTVQVVPRTESLDSLKISAISIGRD